MELSGENAITAFYALLKKKDEVVRLMIIHPTISTRHELAQNDACVMLADAKQKAEFLRELESVSTTAVRNQA